MSSIQMIETTAYLIEQRKFWFSSDENSEEDFEDWDSIGLNVSKPPNLLRLYRDFKRHVVPSKVTLDQSIQTLPGDNNI